MNSLTGTYKYDIGTTGIYYQPRRAQQSAGADMAGVRATSPLFLLLRWTGLAWTSFNGHGAFHGCHRAEGDATRWRTCVQDLRQLCSCRRIGAGGRLRRALQHYLPAWAVGEHGNMEEGSLAHPTFLTHLTGQSRGRGWRTWTWETAVQSSRYGAGHRHLATWRRRKGGGPWPACHYLLCHLPLYLPFS